MRFSVTLDANDWVAYNQHLCDSLQKNYRTWLDKTWLVIILWAAFGLAVSITLNLGMNFNLQTAIAVSAFFILFIAEIILKSRLKQKAFLPSPDGTFIGTHQFTIDEFGIHSSGNGYHGHHGWKLVKRIERISKNNTQLIAIYLDTCFAFIFPENQLENPNDVFQELNALHQKSK